MQSLLDPGQLGFISQALLNLQYRIVGDFTKDRQTKAALQQVKHYHLVQKLGIVQQAGLKLTMPEQGTVKGNLLCKQLNDMKLEGEDMGVPLMELPSGQRQFPRTGDRRDKAVEAKGNCQGEHRRVCRGVESRRKWVERLTSVGLGGIVMGTRRSLVGFLIFA